MAQNGLRRCWAGYLSTVMTREVGHWLGVGQVDVSGIMQTMQSTWWDSCIQTLPTNVAANEGALSVVHSLPDNYRTGFRLFTYFSWFATDYDNKHDTFWYHLNRFDQIQAVAQFRMGVHWLGIETGRHVHTIRSNRICLCCALHVREDEVHLLLCPLYEAVRTKYQCLFHINNVDILSDLNAAGVYDSAMLSIMNPTDVARDVRRHWHDLANFLLECKNVRQMHLSVV
jgi:hypothetical protein